MNKVIERRGELEMAPFFEITEKLDKGNDSHERAATDGRVSQ